VTDPRPVPARRAIYRYGRPIQIRRRQLIADEFLLVRLAEAEGSTRFGVARAATGKKAGRQTAGDVLEAEQSA
jgi:hypothetical protein